MHVAAILSFLAAIICPKELAGRPSSCLIWTFPFPSPLAGVFVPPPSKAFTFTVALTYAPACKNPAASAIMASAKLVTPCKVGLMSTINWALAECNQKAS